MGTHQASTDPDASHPTYATISPFCPVCGHHEFASTEEGVPHNFQSDYVNVTCDRCGTALTIEYSVIDVSWHDGDNGGQSAVSQGLTSPNNQDYPEAEMYCELPPSSVLQALDWPVHCEACDELLTGNDMLTDPGVLAAQDIDLDKRVPFRCPVCDHLHVATPQCTTDSATPA